MANWYTTSTNPVSTDWLFPATAGSCTHLGAASSYFKKFTSGHAVRSVGSGITANGGGPAGNVTSADFVLQGGG
jgi:hypothetical protein